MKQGILTGHAGIGFALLGVLSAIGCASKPAPAPPPRPSVTPTSQPAGSLSLDPSTVKPMYRELLAIDLPTVARVAVAQNLDIQQARHRVAAQRGRYDASVQALFPVIAPSIGFQRVDGVNQNASGTLVDADFSNIVPAVTLQWILNPGRAVYDIIASKRRLQAAREQRQATELETLRLASVQYYDLILAQAKIAVARQAVEQAEESLRLTRLRARAGTGLAADELRATAFLAGRKQDLIVALNNFYNASVSLTVTLHLDPSVTLVPQPEKIDQVMLVDDRLAIDVLMGMAVIHRPDLQAARTLLAAARSDKGTVAWGALGPQLQAAYTYGGLETKLAGDSSGLQEQQKGSASAGFNFGLTTFGQLKTSRANVRAAATQVEQQLDRVRADVVRAQLASGANTELLPIAREQVAAAEEALRLARANVETGTLLLIDVLQAQNELDGARLRYADAVVRYNQSQITLLAALGLLENATLQRAESAAASAGPVADEPSH
jgi:outer membrane protein TolC